jgi:hypothetical protein
MHGRGRGQGHGHGQGHGGKSRSRSRSRSGSRGKHGQKGQYGQQGYGGQGQYGGQQGYGGQGQYGQQGGDKDQILRNNIDQIFSKYDRDGTGYLEPTEFQAFFGELCNLLGRPPVNDYNQFVTIAKSIDADKDGRISKPEIFTVFKQATGY